MTRPRSPPSSSISDGRPSGNVGELHRSGRHRGVAHGPLTCLFLFYRPSFHADLIEYGGEVERSEFFVPKKHLVFTSGQTSELERTVRCGRRAVGVAHGVKCGPVPTNGSSRHWSVRSVADAEVELGIVVGHVAVE